MDMISIIVPVYKVEKYLRKCVDSLLAQEYKDIEVILVDDGSPDRCGEICEEYAQKDSRVRIVHKENGGLSSARNAGLDVMTGQWVMCVDSDDWVETNYCSSALQLAQENDADIVVSGYWDAFPDKTIPQKETEDTETLCHDEALVKLCRGEIQSFAWNKLYRASLFDGVRYPDGRLLEDVGTTYLLFDKAHRVTISPEHTYHYRKRNDSILGKKMNSKKCIDWGLMNEQRFDYMVEQHGDLVPQIAAAAFGTAMFCLKNLLSFPGMKEEKKQMIDWILGYRKVWQNSGIHSNDLILMSLSKGLYVFLRSLISKVHHS